jgi:hypothetical protein
MMAQQAIALESTAHESGSRIRFLHDVLSSGFELCGVDSLSATALAAAAAEYGVAAV